MRGTRHSRDQRPERGGRGPKPQSSIKFTSPWPLRCAHDPVRCGLRAARTPVARHRPQVWALFGA
eukprot:5015512-Prymnesium_polylepis.1